MTPAIRQDLERQQRPVKGSSAGGALPVAVLGEHLPSVMTHVPGLRMRVSRRAVAFAAFLVGDQVLAPAEINVPGLASNRAYAVLWVEAQVQREAPIGSPFGAAALTVSHRIVTAADHVNAGGVVYPRALAETQGYRSPTRWSGGYVWAFIRDFEGRPRFWDSVNNVPLPDFMPYVHAGVVPDAFSNPPIHFL